MKRYVNIPTETINDPDLGLKARGLLCTLLSLPDEYDFSIGNLAETLGVGAKTIRATLRELEEAGYLTRTQTRLQNGQWAYTYMPRDQKK